ncbi:thiol:disulfide interchange protein DsbA/DsbL [Reinekea sp.]|jgi:thiol:disulfide interchange protein DsbA|uniref:thiol:disulfide interchange protein DsbA/DsbL n=1 Tax=Reinekea sp. TaxID=1970455 RepID=UPI002A815B9B|nr:thiol:disulfide interchange protein DsbA/DsbL [Reinekea sp.]
MLKRSVSILFLVLTACWVQAAEPRFVDGTHYTTLATPLKTSYRGAEVGEIMEFFSYGCIHCYNFEPAVQRFLAEKPDSIRYTYVPVMFNERQAPEVRAYYVIELLKLGVTAHQAIFNEIHQQRKALRTDGQFAKFFTRFNLTEDEYLAHAYSFGVNAKVNTSIYLTGNSGIGGTPSIIANGQYLIESGAVGGNEQALYAAKWLIEQDALIQ